MVVETVETLPPPYVTRQGAQGARGPRVVNSPRGSPRLGTVLMLEPRLTLLGEYRLSVSPREVEERLFVRN